MKHFLYQLYNLAVTARREIQGINDELAEIREMQKDRAIRAGAWQNKFIRARSLLEGYTVDVTAPPEVQAFAARLMERLGRPEESELLDPGEEEEVEPRSNGERLPVPESDK